MSVLQRLAHAGPESFSILRCQLPARVHAVDVERRIVAKYSWDSYQTTH